jgi:uncharacterized protein (DUF1919 family)
MITLVYIISNNCWAGYVYQRYNIQYKTPTIGLYFFAEDFIRFLKRLRYYLNLPIVFIPATESKYYDVLKRRNHINCPIGVLDDIEIIFLHYKSEEEAREKWTRRAERVNFDNLIIKFSEMNLCTEKELKEFDPLPYEKKFVFTHVKRADIKCSIYYKGYEKSNEVKNDTAHYCKSINLVSLINEKKFSNTNANFVSNNINYLRICS